MKNVLASQTQQTRKLFMGVVLAILLMVSFFFPQGALAANSTLEAGSVRIHVLPFDYTEAIIIECDGHFGMVDSAEDSSSPDGSNAKYPHRPGTTIGSGHEAEVIAYMKKIGVNQSNFDFYIGTHPHSDHIGSAAQIIREFHPATIYTPVYDDSYISDAAHLWDNQYVYDNLLAAVAWAQGPQGYGAKFIQHLDPSLVNSGEEPKESEVPETPEKPTDPSEDDQQGDGDAGDSDDTENGEGTSGSTISKEGEDEPVKPTEPVKPAEPTDPNTGSPIFNLGSAQIEIVNYDETFRTTKVPDANYFSYGVKVTAKNGRTAFLAGDMNNYTDGDAKGTGDEDRIKATLGKIDFLKLAHHGISGSNSVDYLRTILKSAQGNDRAVVVQTGEFASMPQSTVQVLNEKGARHYQASTALMRGQDAFVVDLTASGVKTNADSDNTVITQVTLESPYAYLYKGGLPYKGTGWHEGSDGAEYYFGAPGSAGSSVALTNCWALYDGKRVYLDERGRMSTEWGKIGSDWYLFDEVGNMLTGWQKVSGKWYYLEADGKMATGWKKINANWYYLDAQSGTMKTGWQVIDGKPYYLKSSGVMMSGKGWKKLDGYWGYVTTSGAFKTGWLKDKGTWYYLKDNGQMATGWAKVNYVWYYLNGSGAMKTGWHKVKGTWYYLNGSGAMQTGWKKSNGKWYYLQESGAMATGWIEVDDTWYYLNGSGAMKTGWQKIGGVWYHFKGSGAMTQGWLKSKGKWYYLLDSGQMVTGPYVVDGTQYRFNSSGAMQ